MSNLYNIAAIRAMETLAYQQPAVTEDELMTRAGLAAFNALKTHWPQAKSVTLFCGKGNNGGDGYVLAHLAHTAGWLVQVLALCPIEQLPPTALQAAKTAVAAGVKITPFTPQLPLQGDVVIDAIFGIGLRGAVTGDAALAIAAINQSKKPVLALDIPSGLDAEQGNVFGIAVHAERTITFIALKQGLFTGEAADYCGIVQCDDLSLPSFPTILPSARLQTETILSALAPRRRTSHKGDYGHVLVIGGDYGMGGAVRLAAEAALRIGAGLVSVATRPEHVAATIAERPEIMCHAVTTPAELAPLLARATVIVLGPGLGQSTWSRVLWASAMATQLPMVLDADGLNLLAEQTTQRGNWILTPHPGEAARLLATSSAEVQTARFTTAQKLMQKFNACVVLKGAGTLIAASNTLPAVCPRGNPGMASGGMGDVLSGIIGGLCAQMLTLPAAAELGVFMHATSADQVACHLGERGMLASDVIAGLVVKFSH